VKRPCHRFARLIAAAAITTLATLGAAPAWAADQPCYQVLPKADGSYDFSPYFHLAPGAYSKTMVQARGLCYADGTAWVEQQYGGPADVTYDQRFEFYRSSALPKTQAVPLIIWSHPNGPTQVMIKNDVGPNETSPLMEKLVVPAVKSGFAFMSIQFRHPRASQSADPKKFDPHVPNTDIANAVQWVRSRAAGLGVDPDNIFLVGQSRGSLALLTAFMADQRVANAGDWHSQSSKPNAVFAAQAQTTYEHVELRDTFFEHFSTVPVPPDTQPGFDYHAYLDRNDLPVIHPGSALASLDLKDPPFWVRYERAPTDHGNVAVVPIGSRVAPEGEDPLKYGTCYEPQATDYPKIAESGCFDEHHPNFGAALSKAFLSLQPTQAQLKKVGVQFGPRKVTQDVLDKVSEHFYDDYTCFFIQNLSVAGEALREQATAPGNVVWCKITDNPWPPAVP
jgi:hypothetical protein